MKTLHFHGFFELPDDFDLTGDCGNQAFLLAADHLRQCLEKGAVKTFVADHVTPGDVPEMRRRFEEAVAKRGRLFFTPRVRDEALCPWTGVEPDLTGEDDPVVRADDPRLTKEA